LDDRKDFVRFDRSYYLKTPDFFAEKKKHATGTKVIDVSAKSLAKIKIPIPPLAIQQEIVKILDTFTTLEAELEARKKQYEYYRDKLLTFKPLEKEYANQ
jgi:type I restriction enzyme S subunit